MLAVDEDDTADCKEVALKLMCDPAAFELEICELQRTQMSCAKHAAAALRFHRSIQLTGAPEYSSCIVFPRGDRTLADAIVHDAFAGKLDDDEAMLKIRDIMLQLSAGLLHLHERSRAVHCDFKPLNAIQFGHVWKLIDFDGTVLIGEAAGRKYSTLVAPPELLTLTAGSEGDEPRPEVREPSSKDCLIAAPSYDVWSFGVVLYNLLVGRTLLLADLNDNLDEEQLHVLRKWQTTDCKHRLDLIETSSIRASHGKDLLYWMLQPVPAHRPSMHEVRMHQFFQDNQQIQLLSCLDFPWSCRHSAPTFKGTAVLAIAHTSDSALSDVFFDGLASRCTALAKHMQKETIGALSSSQGSPRVAALCFSVDRFQAVQLPDLSSCCNDARKIAEELRSIPAPYTADVHLCENADLATFRQTEQAFCSGIEKSTASLELVVVFLASHGVQVDSELFLAAHDTVLSEYSANAKLQLRSSCISVNDLVGNIRKCWNGPLVLIADTCRTSPYPELMVYTRQLAEQMHYSGNILCCFSTAIGAAANDGTSSSHSPFTSALLRCIFASGVAVRSAILDACNLLGKDEQPSCTVMKFPDVALVPVLCEVFFLAAASASTSDESNCFGQQQVRRLEQAISRHRHCMERLIVIRSFVDGHTEFLGRCHEAGVKPMSPGLMSAGNTSVQSPAGLKSTEVYAAIQAVWELAAGAVPLGLPARAAVTASLVSFCSFAA